MTESIIDLHGLPRFLAEQVVLDPRVYERKEMNSPERGE